MTILRRLAAAAGLVLAILGLLVCLAGVAGTWAVKTRAQDLASAIFTAADDGLAFIGGRLARVKTRLDAIRPRITTLSEWADRLRSIELGPDLKPAIDALRERLDALANEMKDTEGGLEPIEAVARTVQSVAAVRAPDVAELAGELARAVSRLEALRARLLEIRENRLVARELAVAVLAEAADLDNRLANLSRRIDDFSTRVSDARASSSHTGRRVQLWIGFGALALAAMLAWFAASQICVMQRVRRLGRRHTTALTAV